MAQEMQNYTDKVYAFKVESVDTATGVARIAVNCESARVSVKHPSLGQVSYSSRTPPAEIDPLVRPDHFLTGQTFYAFVDRKGRVRELEGAVQILQKALRECKYTKDDAHIEEQMKQKYTPEYFIELIELVFRNVPDTLVSQGQTWERQISRPRSVSFKADIRYTLTSYNPTGSASIVINGDYLPNNEAKGIPLQNGMLARYHLKGRETGSAELDAASGALQRKNLSRSESGSLVYTGGSVGFTEVPVSVDTQLTIEPAY
jgi:hypothetical protein